MSAPGKLRVLAMFTPDRKRMTDTLEDPEGTISIGGRTITTLRFADDIDSLP